MLSQRIRKSFNQNNLLFQIIAGCSMGLILGLACQWFPPLLVLGALIIVLSIYAILMRPEIGLLGILIATSSIVFEDQLPVVSIGVSLHIPDILLLGSLGLIVIRWLVEPKFKIVHTLLDWPLLIFLSVTLLSTLIAVFQSSMELEIARRAIRVVFYYLTFFVVTNMVRERRQLIFLLRGIFLLATLVAAAMAAQYMFGNSLTLLPGRVEALNTQGIAYNDITRILPPGHSIVLVAFVTILCILVLEKFKPLSWLKFLQFCLLGMALLFTFLRSYWGALIIVFFILGFILKGPDRQRLINWSMVIVSLVTILLLIVIGLPDSEWARLAGASNERLSTLFSIETFQGEDSSLNYRNIENEYALRQIISHPLLGLGLDAQYRPFDSRLDDSTINSSSSGFIHNGHLKVILNTGLIGYLSLMWLSLTFLIRGFRHWRSIADQQLRGVVLGFTLVYLVVIISAVVNSSFTQWRWTPVIGILMGINEIILMNFGQARQSA